MLRSNPDPNFMPSNYNIFEIINFRAYEALPRWRPSDPDPIFMSNLARYSSTISWHSRYKAVNPHSLQYMALRSITLDDVE